MRTAQLIDGKIELKEMSKPSLDNRSGAIIKVLGCGLCGSDIVKFRHNSVADGTVLGHEIVGIIEEVSTKTDFKIGDKVVCSHHIPCSECKYCLGGSYSMCKHFKETNIFPGGFAEYIYVTEEHLENVAYKIPDTITDEEISFYEPLACCVRAIEKAGLNKNDNVLVVGLGSIGLLMAQGLRSYGMRVICCDILDERIEFAKTKDLDALNSFDLDSFRSQILEKTDNIGVDCVFMTSGADAAIPLALNTVRDGGKILVFSSTPKNLSYTNNDIYYRELTVMGSYSPHPRDLRKSFELLTTGQIDVKNISTNYSLKDISQAFDDTINNKILKAYVEVL